MAMSFSCFQAFARRCTLQTHHRVPSPPSTWPLAFIKQQQHTNHHRCHSSSPSSAPPPSPQPPRIPLCERPPSYITQIATLLDWREQAADRASDVGATWQGQQDAPSVEDLHTELSWLLDDTVVGMRQAPEDPWKVTTWRDLEKQIQYSTSTSSRLPPATEVYLRESLEDLEILWRRRLDDREPIQYLTSCVFWRDLVLAVGPGVLIPRPETELIIDFVLEAVKQHPELGSAPWADLGTGSGALAVGIAHEIEKIPHVYAVDLAAEPAAHAAFNAQRAGVGDRVSVLRGSWYDPLRALGLSGALGGIVSNPPYIPGDLLGGLQVEVGYEPALALGGGEGLGIDCLLTICRGAGEMLRPGGFLALETNGGEQAEYIVQLLMHLLKPVGPGGDEDGPVEFERVKIYNDLRGVGRFVTAFKC